MKGPSLAKARRLDAVEPESIPVRQTYEHIRIATRRPDSSSLGRLRSSGSKELTGRT